MSAEGSAKHKCKKKTFPSLLRKDIFFDLFTEDFGWQRSFSGPTVAGETERESNSCSCLLPTLCKSSHTCSSHGYTKGHFSICILTESHASGQNTSTQLQKPENLSLIYKSFRNFSPFLSCLVVSFLRALGGVKELGQQCNTGNRLMTVQCVTRESWNHRQIFETLLLGK